MEEYTKTVLKLDFFDHYNKKECFFKQRFDLKLDSGVQEWWPMPFCQLLWNKEDSAAAIQTNLSCSLNNLGLYINKTDVEFSLYCLWNYVKPGREIPLGPLVRYISHLLSRQEEDNEQNRWEILNSVFILDFLSPENVLKKLAVTLYRHLEVCLTNSYDTTAAAKELHKVEAYSKLIDYMTATDRKLVQLLEIILDFDKHFRDSRLLSGKDTLTRLLSEKIGWSTRQSTYIIIKLLDDNNETFSKVKEIITVPRRAYSFLRLSSSWIKPAVFTIKFKELIKPYQADEEDNELCTNSFKHGHSILFGKCFVCLLSDSYKISHSIEAFVKIKNELIAPKSLSPTIDFTILDIGETASEDPDLFYWEYYHKINRPAILSGLTNKYLWGEETQKLCKNDPGHSPAILFELCDGCLAVESFKMTHGTDCFLKLKHLMTSPCYKLM
jgi:hypothetical protein